MVEHSCSFPVVPLHSVNAVADRLSNGLQGPWIDATRSRCDFVSAASKQRGRPALERWNGLLATNRRSSAVLTFKIDSKCVVSQSTRARIFRPRRPKVFGFGRPRPMVREDKCRVLLHLRTLRGSPALSRSAFDVAEKLLFRFHNAASGRCFPSLDALARSAGCSLSTVQRAIRALEALKVLSWVHRLEWRFVEVPGLGRQRVPRRTSNGYQFFLPPCLAAPVGVAQGSPWATPLLRPGVDLSGASAPAVVPAVFERASSPLEAALSRLGAALSRSFPSL